MAEPIDARVSSALDGARVDKAVAELFGLSRADAALVVEQGVLLDGGAVRASQKVKAGQLISATPPAAAPEMAAEEVAFDVLYADDEVIVVDKPPGVVVHPGSGRSGGTLAAGLLARFPEVAGVGEPGRWGLVHRLDKDTSGAILIARTTDAYDTLTAAMRRREIARTYRALVEGTMGSPTGTIDAPIGRDPSRPTRQTLTHTGRHARTHYELVRHYPESDATLLEVTLETGRTHQIRVHLAAIGHPVAGDQTYGASRKDLRSPRTFLHASRLVFTHPVSNEVVEVIAPLPKDLESVLESLS